MKSWQIYLDELLFYRRLGYSIKDEELLRFNDNKKYTCWAIFNDKIFDLDIYDPLDEVIYVTNPGDDS